MLLSVARRIRGHCIAAQRTMAAKPTIDYTQPPEDTIFAKIVNKQIPSKVVFENEHVLAIHDLNPQAPVHVLLLPKKPIGGIGDATADAAGLLGQLMVAVPQVAKTLGIHESGYRLVINERAHGQQSVRYLHVHMLGGRQMTWPPG